MAVILTGLPGAGKTSLARAIIKRNGFRYLSRDVVRSAMFQPCSFSFEEKQASFAALKLAAETTIRLRNSVVIEGMPFSRVGEYEDIEEIATICGASCIGFFLDVPINVLEARLARDALNNAGDHAPDRVPSLASTVAARMRSFPGRVHRLDGLLPVESLVAEVIGLL